MPFGGISLLHGPFPVVLAISAALTVVASMVRPGLRWWAFRVVPVVGGAFALTLVLNEIIDGRDQLGDRLPLLLLLAASLPLSTAVLAALGWRRGRRLRRALAILAVPVTALLAADLINLRYAYEPTLGALFGTDVRPALDAGRLGLLAPTPHQATDAVIPHGGNDHGYLTEFRIPGVTSHFAARQAYAWLPPAFFRADHPHLPVVVLLGGTPGRPIDMIRSGGAVGVADHVAATHHGEAPILVFPDLNGSFGADTECVDSRRGAAETYLAHDVPAFVATHFSPAAGARHWAVIGFSEGGTCAMELALRHPTVYGTFVDIAGDRYPNVGVGRAIVPTTIAKLYGGDEAAFQAHDPARLVGRTGDRHVVAWFEVGRHDVRDHAVVPALVAMTRHAGLPTRCRITPGGHDWMAASNAVADSLPRLAAALAAGVPAGS